MELTIINTRIDGGPSKSPLTQAKGNEENKAENYKYFNFFPLSLFINHNMLVLRR